MKTIGEILQNQKSTLGNLIKKSKTTKDIARIFSVAIDSSISKYCQFANYQGGELTVIAANPSWATKIRYLIPDLIKQLKIHPEFREIKKIRYTVASINLSTSKKNPSKKTVLPKISKQNELLWKKTLQNLKDSNKKTQKSLFDHRRGKSRRK